MAVVPERTYQLTPDTPAGKTVRSGVVHFDRLADGAFEHRCLRDGCSFYRKYGTLRGGQRGVTEHLRLTHRVRAIWLEGARG